MTYTDAQRAQAVTLALTVGEKDAARRTGISRRTVNRWLAEMRTGEGHAARIIATSSRKEIAAKLWEAVEIGTGVLSARIVDPDARLSDVANALRVAIDAHAAMTAFGQRTAQDGTVVDFETIEREQQEDRQVLAWLDQLESATDEELAEYLANGGLAQIREASRNVSRG